MYSTKLYAMSILCLCMYVQLFPCLRQNTSTYVVVTENIEPKIVNQSPNVFSSSFHAIELEHKIVSSFG